MKVVRLRGLLTGLQIAAFVGGRTAWAGAEQAESPSPAGEAKESQDARSAHLAANDVSYFQYGVSLTAEMVLAPGNVCRLEPCILGSGGGFAARIGYRAPRNWYFGIVYELTKQDPNNLYRLATLQQLRPEVRYYLETGRDVDVVAALGLGGSVYGNEMGVDTWGPVGSLGAGVEFQVSRLAVLGLQVSYRALGTKSFPDPGSPAVRRDGGIASLLGLDFIVEGRDPR